MKKWIIQDDLLLYKLQPNYTVSDIAKKLGKSKDSVRDRVKILGLRNFENKAPLQYIVYRILELYGDTVDNRFILANSLQTTMNQISGHYNREKKARKKAITAINGMKK